MATQRGLCRHPDNNRQAIQSNGTVPRMPTHQERTGASTTGVILIIEKRICTIQCKSFFNTPYFLFPKKRHKYLSHNILQTLRCI